MRNRSTKRLQARRDEHGSILILSAVFLVVMVAACALAIDIGFQAKDKRDDHKVADLASLDASRALDDINGTCTDALQQANVEQAADASAIRNGYVPTDPGHSQPVVEIGNMDAAKNFTPSPVGQQPSALCWPNSKAVRITVGSVTSYRFIPGSQSQSAQAVSAVEAAPTNTTTGNDGGFSLGSYLANVDSTQAALLNEIVCQALTGQQLPGPASLSASCPKFNLSAASWQSLAVANLSLNELGQALAANGVIASPDQVAGATVGANDLFKATGDALTNRQPPDTADATVMYDLGNGVSGSRPESIPKLVDQQGQQGSAFADSKDVPVGGLVIAAATAQIANSQNAVAVLNTGLTVPGISNIGLDLAVIQGKTGICCGTAPPAYPDPALSTSQLKSGNGMNITLGNLPVTIPGVASPAALSGQVRVNLTGAGADAQMTDARCATNPGMTVTVDPKPYALSVDNTSALSLTVAGLPVSGIGVSASQNIDGASTPVDFAYPAEFSPLSKRVGSTALTLNTLTYTVTVNGTPLGVSAQTVAQAVSSAVNTALSSLNQPMQNVYRELGLNVGGADVWAETLKCTSQITGGGAGTPVLVK